MDIKELQSLIDNDTKEIMLEDDINLESISYPEIIIDRDSLIIDGNYHYINSGDSLLFNVLGEDITLKNMIFKDFKIGYDILIDNHSSKLNLESCIFKSNMSCKSLISNHSNLRITDCKFIDNTFEDEGVLLYNKGRLNVTSTSFNNNIAMMSNGACILNDSFSTCKMIDSIFNNNKAEYGSCIYNMQYTDVVIKNSIFFGNTVEYEGGAIYNKSKLKIIHSIFEDNIAFKGDALYNEGELIIKYCDLSENSKNVENTLFNDMNGIIKSNDRIDYYMEKREKIKSKIMFVCTANTCRSAMAEVIFKTMVREDVEVYSAGINADTGRHASKNTIEVCKKHGLDVSEHLATNIIDSDILNMDLVLTATWEHKEKLKEICPQLKEVYTMKEYADIYPYDIPDPYGYDIESYDACFKEIYNTLERIHL